MQQKPAKNDVFSGREITGVSGEKSGISTVVSGKKESIVEKVFWFSGRGLKIRWKIAISVAVVLSPLLFPCRTFADNSMADNFVRVSVL